MRPRYSLPLLYALVALFVIISEWNDTGWMARLGTFIVTAPWSVWIPDYINFMYWDLLPNGRIEETNVNILIAAIVLNAWFLAALGWLFEILYAKVKSILTK
jgi:hypothetical protein